MDDSGIHYFITIPVALSPHVFPTDLSGLAAAFLITQMAFPKYLDCWEPSLVAIVVIRFPFNLWNAVPTACVP